METLSNNWVTENLIDFEYKKYVLLGYLQHVQAHYNDKAVYPYLSDVIGHFNNLNKIKLEFDNLQQLNKRIVGLDAEKLKFEYEKVINDQDFMLEVNRIVDFSLPLFERYMLKGKDVYDTIEKQIDMQPVGLLPLNKTEGYLLIQNGKESKQVDAYRFGVGIYETKEERYKSVYLRFVCSFSLSIRSYFEQIKLELIHLFSELPNPSVYSVVSLHQVPLTESLLPISKRKLIVGI